MNQQVLRLLYRDAVARGGRLPAFDDTQFKIFSQNGEDGILWLLFSVLGTVNKRCVEVCAGAGIECNSANLIINDGWHGLLFDGDLANVRQGRSFYKRCSETSTYPPELVHAWISAENINELISSRGFTGEIDLFSLDLDGVDFWIWKALEVVTPRVVVLEYNNLWPATDSVSVPYGPDFVADYGPTGPNYAGASLAAFVSLGRQKGYRLIGCERYGFNAFFVRNGLGEELFPEVSVESCLSHPFVKLSREQRLPLVRDKMWVRI